MNIAIIQQSPDIGGAEMFTYQLTSEFLKRNNTIYFFTNKGKFFTYIKTLPVKLYEIPKILDVCGNVKGLIKSLFYLPYLSCFYYKALSFLRNKKQIDVILASGFSEKLFVTSVASFLHIPIVWIEYAPLSPIFQRNFFLPKLFYFLLKNFPKVIIVPTPHTEKSLIDLHIDKEKLVVIPCGTKPSQQTKKNNTLLQKLGLGKHIIIGNVSRLTREKGQEYLIRAMEKVIREVPNVSLLILGQGPDKAYFRTLIKELHLAPHVKLLGFREDLELFYNTMDIFVFPTVWSLEGFGLVLIEAMAHRLPVVATDIGPVPHIVKDGKVGLLVPPRNEKTLAEAIIKLAKDEKLRIQMGEEGYKRVRQFYNLNETSTSYLRVLYNAARER